MNEELREIKRKLLSLEGIYSLLFRCLNKITLNEIVDTCNTYRRGEISRDDLEKELKRISTSYLRKCNESAKNYVNTLRDLAYIMVGEKKIIVGKEKLGVISRIKKYLVRSIKYLT